MRFSEPVDWMLSVILFTAAAFGHGLSLTLSLPVCMAFIWFRRSRSPVLIGSFLAAGMLLLWQASWPVLWSFTPQLRLGGISPVLLVPSCALVPFAVLALSRPRMAAAFVLALCLASGAFCLLLSGFAESSGMPPARMADVLFFGRGVVLLIFIGAAVLGGIREELGSGTARAALPSGLAVCLLAGVMFAIQWTHAGRAMSGNPRVAFWCKSLNEGRFSAIRDSPPGLNNIGLFGEVPELLKSYRFQVGSLTSLERISTREWDALFLLTPPRQMSSDEREAVASFVASGGRLVVAAEHTDLDSNATCYNPLLERYGIRIAFDTTTSVCSDTIAGTSASPGTMGRLFRQSSRLAYNRGASLELHGHGARPVLCGDWWWSEAGDPGAAERGQMGDEVWSSGDAFGRRVLVASCRVGKSGQVVVFADTSPFINRNMVYNGRFIADFFGLLTGRPVNHSATLRRNVYISTAECNGLPLRGFEEDAPTGLGVAALRSGLGVRTGTWRDLRAEDILVVAKPRIRIDRARLLGHVMRGGTALVCGSGAESAFTSFAASLGCTAGARPLGPVAGQLAVLEAWEMAVPVDAANITPLVAQGKSIGAILKIGQGRLFLICDRMFISNRNIETEAARNEDNVPFMERLLHGDPDSPSKAGM